MHYFLGFITIFAIFLYKVAYRIVGKYVWLENWKTKSIFITGCDSGFGYHTALRLTDLGITVFAGCLTDKGQELLRTASSRALNLNILNVNITSDISVKTARHSIKSVLGASGKLWAIINNAAVEKINAPDDFLTVEHYKQHMDVNLYGTIRVCHVFKPLIKASKGRIVLVTSIKGRLVFPECGPYTLTKWATEAYADTLRMELDPFGVTVHVVEPGGYFTGLIREIPDKFEELWMKLNKETKLEYGEEYFRNRLAMLHSIRHKTSKDVDSVVDSYVEAALSRFPRYRYLVGWDLLYRGYFFVSFLPEFFQNVYWKWQLKDNEKPLAAQT